MPSGKVDRSEPKRKKSKTKIPQVTDNSPSKDSGNFPVSRPPMWFLGTGMARGAAEAARKRNKRNESY